MCRILDSYAREAAVTEKRSASVQGQHQINIRRIRSLGMEYGIKVDDMDGSDSGWGRLNERLRSGVTNGVVIFRIRQFLYQPEEVAHIASLFEGGAVVYDSDAELDVSTSAQLAAFLDAARGAQDHRRHLSERVRAGNRRKAARGEGRRGRYRPVGFEEDGTTVRESERVHLREAARRVLAGEGWPDVCNYLNGQGFYSTAQIHTCGGQPSCTCPRRPWTTVALRSALTAPRMAGFVKLGSDLEVGTLPGEPILAPDDWHALRNLVQSRRGRPPVDNYLCTGKDSPVRCAYCGGHLSINSGGRGKTYGDGELRRYYRCLKSSGGCGRTIADWRALDKAIEAMVLDRLSSPAQLREIRQLQQRRAARARPYEEEIARLESLQAYWGERLNSGEISEAQHRDMLQDLNQKMETEQRALAGAVSIPASRLSVEELAAFAGEWAQATPAQKRERLRQAYAGFRILITPGSSVQDDVRDRVADPIPIDLPTA